MSTFLKLVRHELKYILPNTSRGLGINALIAVVVFLGLTTGLVIGLNNGMQTFQYLNQFNVSVIFSAFGIGGWIIQKEFKKNTASWWLTLPYPRELLYRAKGASLLLFYFYFYIQLYLVIKISCIVATIYTDKWNQFPLEELFRNDEIFLLTSFLCVILVGAFTTSVSLLARKFTKTSFLFWIPFGTLVGSFMPNFFSELVMPSAKGEMISVPIYLWIGSPLLTILFYILGSHVLKKYVDL
ncbi:hypothetical protein [Thermoactinomyces sp. DSM 45892]|uniref:hypothetical protein n=1 Tax=Thermoactinomyces sp. DSM 45892 TaxID=1882753 RepID=UPI0008952A2C|nr:hypothetical protein [Thermoactinomyces sp. DSM 45892]SDY92897.1 hypothetical protein SAMN05444416_11047 [Thermoactinomyces sp. DSM 45892]